MRCASRARTRSTSPSSAPPSSTWSRTTSRSPTSCCNTAAGRPALLQRFPEGRRQVLLPEAGPGQRPELAPDHRGHHAQRHTSNALVVADIAHVLWAVNLGCLGLHLWPYRADDPDHADELRIDLDPQPGTAFDEIRTAAGYVPDLFDELGIVGYPKTTGNRGLHVYVRLEPRWDSFEVRAGAVALARELERRYPDLITANWWKEERGERIFVDFNQNAPHKTVFGAWFARPRVGGQVSTPLAWDEVDTVDPEELTIRTVPDLVRRRGDPWAGIADHTPVAPTPVGHGGAGPGRRAARRALAARIPQAARRTASGGAEPGQEGIDRCSLDPSTPCAASPTSRARRRRVLQGPGLPQRRRGHRRRARRRTGGDDAGRRLQKIPGVGKTSAQVIAEALPVATPGLPRKARGVDRRRRP